MDPHGPIESLASEFDGVVGKTVRADGNQPEAIILD
jgi:hypothetical protein